MQHQHHGKAKGTNTKQYCSGAVLEAGGSSLAKAVKVNVFLANMDDFAAVNEVYTKFFPDPKPVSISCRVRHVICQVTVPDKT